MGEAISLLIVSILFTIAIYMGFYKGIGYVEYLTEKFYIKMRLISLAVNLLFSLAVLICTIIRIVEDKYNLLIIGIIIGVQFVFEIVYIIILSLVGYNRSKK